MSSSCCEVARLYAPSLASASRWISLLPALPNLIMSDDDDYYDDGYDDGDGDFFFYDETNELAVSPILSLRPALAVNPVFRTTSPNIQHIPPSSSMIRRLR